MSPPDLFYCENISDSAGFSLLFGLANILVFLPYLRMIIFNAAESIISYIKFQWRKAELR